MKVLTLEEIRQQYPDQWVFLGNPEWKNGVTLEQGIVLLAGKDKRDFVNEARELKKEYKTTTCIYTGKPSGNPKWISMWRVKAKKSEDSIQK